MTGKAAFFGNSFLGDTILNLALIRAIQEKEQYQEVIFPVLYEMGNTLVYLMKEEDLKYIRIWSNRFNDAILNTICDPELKPEEYYKNGRVHYVYRNLRSIYLAKRRELNFINDFVRDLNRFGVTTVYIAHWTFGFLYLAHRCADLGIKVVGFSGFAPWLSEAEVEYVTHDGHKHPGGVWTNEFIGDKLAKWFTGQHLRRDHFYIKQPETESTNDYVLVMPSSRSQIPTVGFWDLDPILLHEMGYRPKIGLWRPSMEDYEQALHSIMDSQGSTETDIIKVENFGQTIDLIHNAKAVVTPDSGQFHVAWILGKPALVKLKEGLLDEWMPRELAGWNYRMALPVKPFMSGYASSFKSVFGELVGGV